MNEKEKFIDNYDAYVKGKEPLKFATRIKDDQIFKLLKKETNKRFWILPKLYEEAPAGNGGAGAAVDAPNGSQSVSIGSSSLSTTPNPTPPTKAHDGTADFPPLKSKKLEEKKSKGGTVSLFGKYALDFHNFCKCMK